MFGFLKNKLKDAISKFSGGLEKPKEEKAEGLKEEIIGKKEQEKGAETVSKIEKENFSEEKKTIEKTEKVAETREETKELHAKEKEESRGLFAKIKEKITEKPKEEKQDAKEEKADKEEKKGFFDIIKEKVTTTRISDEKFNDLFNELELALLENNVAFEVVEKIKSDLKRDLVDKPIKRGSVEKEIDASLKGSIEDLFLLPKIDLVKRIDEKEEKPFVVCFLGQNGGGKTTSIAKVANYLKNHKKSVVLAAGDTFRAASIEQLKEWGNALNIRVISHDYGSDAAAVAFDAIKFAKSHNIDAVLVDTAGRQHSNANLMREMEKIIRVTKPDLKIFVGEAITGSDVVAQSEDFNKTVGIDGIILTKADVDEKGGAIVSISYITHRPIMFLGTGQKPSDIKEFDKEEVVKNLGLA